MHFYTIYFKLDLYNLFLILGLGNTLYTLQSTIYIHFIHTKNTIYSLNTTYTYLTDIHIIIFSIVMYNNNYYLDGY